MSKIRSIDFDWNHARALLVTAETGSLSAAARALGTTQPTLSRQVAALEKSLGVAIFENSHRGYAPTPDGAALIEYIKEMSDAANRFSIAAMSRSDAINGLVTVSAPKIIAYQELCHIVVDLKKKQPELQIELIASNKASNLIRREADIAIRAFRPTQQDLIAKKLFDQPLRLFASNKYLSEFGIPKTTSDLSRHSFLSFKDNESFENAIALLELPITQNQFGVIAEFGPSYQSLLRAGAGIGLLPEIVGRSDPELSIVLPDLKLLDMSLWLVSHRELRSSKKIRYVFDFIAKELERKFSYLSTEVNSYG